MDTKEKRRNPTGSSDPYYQTHLPKRYNPKKWDGDAFQASAKLEEMYDRINSLNPSLVIDVGCGRNLHKQHIKNLIGFDASPFPEVDVVGPILDVTFEPNSADAVLCLGSVQFISKEYILNNMARILSWVKPGGLIEMRVMVTNEEAIAFQQTYDPNSVKYPWSPELRKEIMDAHNLEFVIEPWTYQADAIEEKIIRDRDSNQVLRRKNLSRECWTWRKIK